MARARTASTDEQPAKAAEPEEKAPDATDSPANDPTLLASRTPVGDNAEPVVAREAQFPSRIGQEGVEVAERTVDIDTAEEEAGTSSAVYIKKFVLLKREWDEHTAEQKGTVHERNVRAVRQFMVGNGLRPTGATSFDGEEVQEVAQTGRLSNDSVVLTYSTPATPTALTGSDVTEDADIELLHTVIPQDGASAQEQADYEASTQDRVLAGRAARLGEVPGPKPSLTATA